MQPGQVALVPVTYIEERNGSAVVRLPNGSKTTLQNEALEPVQAHGHFVRASQGDGGTVYCLECDWCETFAAWSQGVAV